MNSDIPYLTVTFGEKLKPAWLLRNFARNLAIVCKFDVFSENTVLTYVRIWLTFYFQTWLYRLELFEAFQVLEPIENDSSWNSGVTPELVFSSQITLPCILAHFVPTSPWLTSENLLYFTLICFLNLCYLQSGVSQYWGSYWTYTFVIQPSSSARFAQEFKWYLSSQGLYSVIS